MQETHLTEAMLLRALDKVNGTVVHRSIELFKRLVLLEDMSPGPSGSSCVALNVPDCVQFGEQICGELERLYPSVEFAVNPPHEGNHQLVVTMRRRE